MSDFVLTAPRPERRFARFVASVTFAFAGLWLAMPLSAVLLAERGVPPATIGALAATVWGASVIATPLTPWLASRLGGTLALHRAAAALAALALALLPFAGGSLPIWFLLGALLGIGSSLAWTGSDVTALGMVEPERAGRAIGLYQTFVSAAIGAGPLILTATGARAEGFWAAALLLLIGLAVGAPLREPVAAGPSRPPSLRRSALVLLALPAAGAAALLSGGYEAVHAAILPVQGLGLGFDPMAAALLPAAAGLGNLLSQYALGHAVERLGPGRVALALAPLAAVLAWLWPLAAGTPAVWPLVALLGGTVGAWYTLGMLHAAGRIAGRGRTVAIAGLNTAYLLGGVVAPPLAGLVLGVAPAALPAVLGVAALLGGAGVALGLRSRG